ncbi:hypothetical protein J9317_08470 [Metabacillus sp. KIGAM252]|uniref:DUF6884 domain-containing protein n=1 Tax=Metabacillus flavus TaxID=2823519 RepID=A0ABS5LDW7_9BACI|nr:DUF6884 domain-containing protein [Metabacillus flavus]MBS2968789.1 hypothetical protein [Metabacillus flavus]
MKRLCIIPCGKRKIWDKQPGLGPVPAQSAYTGIFHKLCQTYARTFFTSWVILSAKHGFLKPEELVPGNYDLAFQMKHPDMISIRELQKQLDEKELNDADQIVMLGGKKFDQILCKVFGRSAIFPLKGSKGIGDMQRKLKVAVENKTEII